MDAIKLDNMDYLLICNTSDGLVAQLNGVVIQLQLARRLGLEPIVYLHERSFFFGERNPYYQDEHGQNVWEYYFEPIGVPVDRLPALVRSNRVFTIANASELWRLYRWDPESFFMIPYGYYRSVENMADVAYPHEWWLAQRRKARVFLEDGTIRVKRQLVDQARRFAEDNFSSETLGLQLRGSDKYDFGMGPNLSRKVPPEEYFPYIDQYLAEHPACTRIFVATDQRKWLADLESAYPGKILSCSELSLSEDNQNRIHDQHDRALRGAEPLVDALLLSRCSFLFKCQGAVGELALVLNPDLAFVDLNYDRAPFTARPGLLRPLLNPLIRNLCIFWKEISRRYLGLSRVVSIEQERIFVDGRRPRLLPPLTLGRIVAAAFRHCVDRLAQRCYVYRERRFVSPEDRKKQLFRSNASSTGIPSSGK